MNPAIQACYFVAAVLFIVGLKSMSSPKTARKGVIWAGAGMLVATLATFFYGGMDHYILMIVAILIGGVGAWYSGRKVAMTDMPQMVALYNGMGGGAAACIAGVELFSGEVQAGSIGFLVLAVVGAFIGAVSFSGSLIAFAKLQGWMKKALRISGQHLINGGLLVIALVLGALIMALASLSWALIFAFFAFSLVLGVLVTMPIGGADMPVVISLYNAMTGLAVAFEGFAIGNPAMIIAGTLVGAAGSLLTSLMAKAMNRSLANVLFSGFGADEGAQSEGPQGEMKSMDPSDAGISMAYSSHVIIVPGYGMAVAQAQHKLWEFVQLLQKHDVDVKFAIHPVAGRMPGHMNVLLAEAGVPYDMIFDLEEVNDEFATADYSLVIGANDVVNPAARTNKSSPIYGMPILNVDKTQNALVIKRGRGTGFSGVENELFFAENTNMVFGDAKDVCAKMVAAIKDL